MSVLFLVWFGIFILALSPLHFGFSMCSYFYLSRTLSLPISDTAWDLSHVEFTSQQVLNIWRVLKLNMLLLSTTFLTWIYTQLYPQAIATCLKHYVQHYAMEDKCCILPLFAGVQAYEVTTPNPGQVVLQLHSGSITLPVKNGTYHHLLDSDLLSWFNSIINNLHVLPWYFIGCYSMMFLLFLFFYYRKYIMIRSTTLPTQQQREEPEPEPEPDSRIDQELVSPSNIELSEPTMTPRYTGQRITYLPILPDIDNDSSFAPTFAPTPTPTGPLVSSDDSKYEHV